MKMKPAGGMKAPPISGYRDLTEEELAAVNEIKAIEQRTRKAIRKAINKLPGLDRRWVAVGNTDLQTAFMAIMRGVTKPEPGPDLADYVGPAQGVAK